MVNKESKERQERLKNDPWGMEELETEESEETKLMLDKALASPTIRSNHKIFKIFKIFKRRAKSSKYN